jgi:hypothetical protein
MIFPSCHMEGPWLGVLDSYYSLKLFSSQKVADEVIVASAYPLPSKSSIHCEPSFTTVEKKNKSKTKSLLSSEKTVSTKQSCMGTSSEICRLRSALEVSSSAVIRMREESKQESRSPPSRSVSFSNLVDIKTLHITVGEHPCCVQGLALTNDWSTQSDEVVLLDEHSSRPKRKLIQLRMDYFQRRERLCDCMGISSSDLLWKEHELTLKEAEDERDDEIRKSRK